MNDTDHDLLIRIDQRLTDLCVTIKEMVDKSKIWDESVHRIDYMEVANANRVKLLTAATSATGGILGFILSSVAHMFGWKF